MINDETIDYVGIAVINEAYEVYIQKRNTPFGNQFLEAGYLTNSGLKVTNSMEIDNCFTFDENLQAFIEMIESEDS